MRERALERTAAIAIGSDVVMCRGMRAWMETDSWKEVAPVAPVFREGSAPPDPFFQQMVAVWASVLVGQAERSCHGH